MFRQSTISHHHMRAVVGKGEKKKNGVVNNIFQTSQCLKATSPAKAWKRQSEWGLQRPLTGNKG